MSYINAMITSGLAFAIPLFIMAVGGIYSEKSGITNLAVEGFQGFGAFCGFTRLYTRCSASSSARIRSSAVSSSTSWASR